MPMQAPANLLAATRPVFCPKGRGRGHGIRWEHHHGVPKGKKCRGHRGGQETPSGRRFCVEGAVGGDLLAFCGRRAQSARLERQICRNPGLIVFAADRTT